MRLKFLCSIVTLFLVICSATQAQQIDLYSRLLDPVALARLSGSDFGPLRLNYGFARGIRQSETDSGYWVCAEDSGVGVITHLFATARTPDSLTQYRLYVDDKLVRSATLNGFFRLPFGQLRAPFDTIVGEARLCDVQIPYSRNFRLLYRSPDPQVFFNYGWRPLHPTVRLPGSADLFANTLLTSQARAESIYRAPQTLWTGFADHDTVCSTTIAAGRSSEVLRLIGPAVICNIRIVPDAYSVSLDSVWLEIRYDDELQPSFNAPLMSLFGQSYDFRTLTSLPILFSRDSGFEMRLPLPFARSVRVSLRNATANSTMHVGTSVAWRGYQVTSEYGYLHSHFSETPRTVFGVPHSVLHTAGKGRFIGMLMGIHDLGSMATFEGDPIFTVDSNRLFNFHYDGFEDYFNGAQYFSHGEFLTPFAGTTDRKASFYRFHYLDAVDFTKSFDLDFQHGSENFCWEHYRTIAFWYQQPMHFWTSKDTVRRGTLWRISGAGYSQYEPITIRIAKSGTSPHWSIVESVLADHDGRFDVSPVLDSIPNGFYSLAVNEEVYPRTLLIHGTASLQLMNVRPRPLTLQTNDTVEVAGEGFILGDSLIATLSSTTVDLHYRVDSLSHLHGWLVIPSIPTGIYAVSVCGSATGCAYSDELIHCSRTLQFEAEDLWDSNSSAPGRSSPLNLAGLYTFDWSHFGVVAMKAAKLGDTLGLSFFIPQTDSFLVFARCAVGHRYGNFDIALDNQYCLSFSPYRDVYEKPSDSLILGTFELPTGYHRITFSFTGKTALGNDSALWCDYIQAIPIQRQSVGRTPTPVTSEMVIPNPVHSNLLELQDCNPGEYIRVIDITGNTRVAMKAQTQNLSVSLLDLPNGVYYVSSPSRTGRFILER